MDKEREAICNMTCSIIAETLRWITSGGRERVETNIHIDPINIFITVDELIGLRDTDNILNYFQIAAIGNPFKYPIDILEVVHQLADDEGCRLGGVYIRYKNNEFPLILTGNILALDGESVGFLVNQIIGDNEDLLKLIEHNSPGGKRAAKKSG